MKFEWRPLAETDLAEIVSYIADDNAQAAYGVAEAIERQAEMLLVHPRMGRRGRVKGTRELVIPDTPYILAYLATDKAITILRILHGARKWPGRF
jgi:toxin ParE1/3/4